MDEFIIDNFYVRFMLATFPFFVLISKVFIVGVILMKGKKNLISTAACKKSWSVQLDKKGSDVICGLEKKVGRTVDAQLRLCKTARVSLCYMNSIELLLHPW